MEARDNRRLPQRDDGTMANRRLHKGTIGRFVAVFCLDSFYIEKSREMLLLESHNAEFNHNHVK